MSPARFACVILITLRASIVLAGSTTESSELGQMGQTFQLDDDDIAPKSNTTAPTTQPQGRYFFNLLDSRSSYGKDFFPDTFLGPNFDTGSQIQLSYLHTERRQAQEDEVEAEFEWTVYDKLTLTAEFGWDSEHESDIDSGVLEHESSSGFENVTIGASYPIFQLVNADGTLDYTAAARLEAGIPTRTPVSSTQVTLTPYLGQLLRIGQHTSVQTWTGVQCTLGSENPDQIIYGVSFAYQIFQNEFPWHLTAFTPTLEFDGQQPLTTAGQDALIGIAGFETSLKSFGDVQPLISIGYEFPIDQGARENLRWGILVQFYLDF
jgi:hypothetical protein